LTINVAELPKTRRWKCFDAVDYLLCRHARMRRSNYVSLRSALANKGGSLGEILLRGRAMPRHDVVRAWVDASNRTEVDALSTSLRTPNAAPSIWLRLPMGRRPKDEAVGDGWS
jgi:hypothetical protein